MQTSSGQDVVSNGRDTVREVPATLRSLGDGRRELGSWLGQFPGLSAGRCEEITLVFVELLANAVEASYPTDLVRYAFDRRGSELSLRVENDNPFGRSVELHSMPDPFAVEGRGLALAQQLADRVEINALGSSVIVSAHFGVDERS